MLKLPVTTKFQWMCVCDSYNVFVFPDCVLSWQQLQVTGGGDMAVATTCFKWAELLETQFDKSWIELDTLLLQLEEDEDYSWVQISTNIYTYPHAMLQVFGKSRRHAASLASCFAQLGHKAGLVFQTNAKLEAELVHLREELASTRVTIDQIHRCRVHRYNY